MRLLGMLSEPLIANKPARDPDAEACYASLRLALIMRRTVGLLASVLLLAVAAVAGELSPLLIALPALFVTITEIEFALTARASSRRRIDVIATSARIAQLPLAFLGLYALVGSTWIIVIALILILLGSCVTGSARELLVVTVAASTANWLFPEIFALSGLAYVGWGDPDPYGTLERTGVSLVGLPALSAVMYLWGRQIRVVQDRLARVVRELRETQSELEASQENLQRWNHELNEEIQRKTGALEQRNRYLSIINAASFALAEPMDDGGMLERAARLVARLLGVRAAQAYYNHQGDVTHLFVTVAADDVYAPRLPETLLRHVTRTGRPLTSDGSGWTEDVQLPDLGEPYAVVPIVAKGNVLGAFALVGTSAIQWGDQERHLLLLVGREMGVALENARLYREAVLSAGHERLLSEFARLLQEPRRERAIPQALALLAEELGSPEVIFVEYEGNRRHTRMLGHVPPADHGPASIESLLPSLATLARDRWSPLVLGQGGEQPLSAQLATQGVGTLIVAPVIAMRTVEPPVGAGDQGDRTPIARPEQVGLLAIATGAGQRWDERTTDLIQRVAGNLARRLEVDALASLQQQRIRELAALADVARIMQSGSDTERLCAGFAQALSSLLPFRRLYLAQRDELGELAAVSVYASDGRSKDPAELDRADERHPWFNARGPRRWRRGESDPPAFLAADDHEVIVVPMRPKGQMLGVAAISLDRRVRPEQLHMVEQAVEQLALALDNATLYQQATARASHIQTLSNLARIVASVVDLREAFSAFAEEVRWLMPFDRAVMLLLDAQETHVEPYALYPVAEVAGEPAPLAGSIAAAVVEAGGAIALSPVDPRYASLEWSVFGSDAVEVAAVPVRRAHRTLAIFAVVHRAKGAYASLDLGALDEVAGLLAVTMERLRLYEQAEHGARHDLLTGLPNYRYLQERLQEVKAGITDEGETAVMLVDLDNLKLFNDTLGHEAGDQAIKTVARVLRESCRAEDFVARTGGDEFTIVLEHAGAQEALRVAERIHGTARDSHLELPGAPVRIGLSIGIAVAPGDGSTPADLLQAADLAMYDAKFDGGHRTRLAGHTSDGGSQRLIPRRSHRIADTLARSVLGGATPDERAALALAQRWVSAAALVAEGGDELAPVARMLVAVEVAGRLLEQRDDPERELAMFMMRELQDDWRNASDPARVELAARIVPAAVSLAWEGAPGDVDGADGVSVLAALAAHWGADPQGQLWQAFVDAILTVEDRRRSAAA